jgi:hypothetical protein
VSEELVSTARSLDDAVLELRGLTRLATDWLELGDFARAEAVIEARAELAARIGHPRYLWQTPLLRSMLAMPKGEFRLCDDAIEEATAIGQEGFDVNAGHVIARHKFWLLLLRRDAEGTASAGADDARDHRRLRAARQRHRTFSGPARQAHARARPQYGVGALRVRVRATL